MNLQTNVARLEIIIANHTAELDVFRSAASNPQDQPPSLPKPEPERASVDAKELATLSRTVKAYSDMLDYAASQMQACKEDNQALLDKNELLEVDLELRGLKIRKRDGGHINVRDSAKSIILHALQAQDLVTRLVSFDPTGHGTLLHIDLYKVRDCMHIY